MAWSLRPSSCGERNENTQDRDRGVDAAGRAELRPKRERRPGRPRVDEPAAALLHEGAQSETRKTLVSNFSYKKKHQEKLVPTFRPSLSSRYLRPSLCASALQPASPSTSALLWAWACLLSWVSPSGALVCRLGGPRRKCLWGFWTETRVTCAMIPSRF